ncbi:transporter [Desulfocurvus sp. DL9XJH121]
MKRLVTILAILALLAVPLCASAQDAATPKPGSATTATFGPAGMGFPKGLFAVVANLRYMESDHVRKWSDEQNDAMKFDKFVLVGKTRYGITDDIDIRTATAIYDIDIERTGNDDTWRRGIGDTTVLLHQVLTRESEGAFAGFALDYGLILPTATVDQHSVDSVGNGAWGLMGGIGLSKNFGPSRFDAELNYATFFEGAHDYTHGDRFRWNSQYIYALNDYFDLGVESNLEWTGSSQLHGENSDDSSLEIYLGPKVNFKYKPWGLTTGLAFMSPVYRWYENTKAGSDDYRVECKITKTFRLGALLD